MEMRQMDLSTNRNPFGKCQPIFTCYWRVYRMKDGRRWSDDSVHSCQDRAVAWGARCLEVATQRRPLHWLSRQGGTRGWGWGIPRPGIWNKQGGEVRKLFKNSWKEEAWRTLQCPIHRCCFAVLLACCLLSCAASSLQVGSQIGQARIA